MIFHGLGSRLFDVLGVGWSSSCDHAYYTLLLCRPRLFEVLERFNIPQS